MRLLCTYGVKTYAVDFDPRESQYYGLMPSVMSLNYLSYYSTIDDAVMIDVAEQLKAQLKDESDFYKASALLAFVQQNIEYVSDESRFGKDVWELPIYVLAERKADCDGMANLYTCLAHLVGLDVITVAINGHMLSAVKIRGHGKYYTFEGKRYYHMETTDVLPAAGRYWGEEELITMAKPLNPNIEFKEKLIR